MDREKKIMNFCLYYSMTVIVIMITIIIVSSWWGMGTDSPIVGIIVFSTLFNITGWILKDIRDKFFAYLD